jgi:hypothetical protein
MTKDGFFRKYEYVYDEYYDCYICPENHILNYSTTNRDGYKEYKSCGDHCAVCRNLKKCTESKEHVKVVTRHVWEEYMEMAEDIRHTLGNKQIYNLRKETIERIFGTAKEQHGFRYTQYVGKARMEMKAGLTFACMNLKKLAKMIANSDRNHSRHLEINRIIMYEMEKWCRRLTPTPTLSTVCDVLFKTSGYSLQIDLHRKETYRRFCASRRKVKQKIGNLYPGKHGDFTELRCCQSLL